MIKFSSWDDYFYPGTEVLKNKRDIRDQQQLRVFEELITLAELSNILTHDPVLGDFDRAHMKAIHRRIFGRVYEWAGQERVGPFPEPMLKLGPSPESIAHGNYTANVEYPYPYYPANDDMVPHFDRYVRMLHSYGDMSSESPRGFAEKIAEPWGEINVAHIFREGNTRTQVALFTKFARHHGHDLDFDRFTTDPDFRAKFNAGRFLIQANLSDELFTEALTEALEGSSDASVNPMKTPRLRHMMTISQTVQTMNMDRKSSTVRTLTDMGLIQGYAVPKPHEGRPVRTVRTAFITGAARFPKTEGTPPSSHLLYSNHVDRQGSTLRCQGVL